MNPISVLTSFLGEAAQVTERRFDISLRYIPESYAVYLIMLPDNTFYIGGTTRLYHRLNQHRGHLRAGTHINKQLQKAYNESNEVDIILIYVDLPDKHTVKTLEQMLLDELYKSNNCVNVSESATTVKGICRATAVINMISTKRTDEYRALVSANSKQMWQNNSYRENQIAARGESIVVDGIKYNSVRQASRETGISIQALRNAMVNGVVISSDVRPTSRSVSINGTVYRTVNDAAKALGVAPNTMTWRCQSDSPKWSEHRYV